MGASGRWAVVGPILVGVMRFAMGMGIAIATVAQDRSWAYAALFAVVGVLFLFRGVELSRVRQRAARMRGG